MSSSPVINCGFYKAVKLYTHLIGNGQASLEPLLLNCGLKLRIMGRLHTESLYIAMHYYASASSFRV